MKLLRFALSAFVLFLCATAACGHSPESGFAPGGADGGPGYLADGAPIPSGDGPSLTPPNGDGSTPLGALVIAPLAPVVTIVSGQPLPTVQFTAAVGGQAVTAKWLLDRGELGKIDAAGLFTPAGNIGGTGNINASYGGVAATTTITVIIQLTQYGDPAAQNPEPPPGPGGYGGVGGDGPGVAPPSGPTGSQVGTLNGTPTPDSTVTLLYPYDGTVWPQALLAPLLQWYPGSHSFDSVYVHIQEKSLDYKGYFSANKKPFLNVPVPQDAWTTMGYSNGGEPVTVSIVFAEGAAAFGPYTQTWKVAQGALQGTIYYNSYGTSLVQNSDLPDKYGTQYGAGTLAIAPGAAAPTLVAGVPSAGNGTGCRVCHTASADGTTLVTQGSDATATTYASSVYVNLTTNPTAGAGTPLATANLAFPALFRDGSLLFSSAAVMNTSLIPGDGTSKLYSLPSGALVAGVAGLPAGFQAGLPSFSPDGKHVSFNFWGGTLPGGAVGDKVSLGIIDFDGSKTFSNPRVVYTPPGVSAGEPAVTYSSFLPNSTALVFETELTNPEPPPDDWAYTWAISGTTVGHTAELWWLDVGTGNAHRLDQLNGVGAGGTPYLPGNAAGLATHTAAQDVTVNYEPTVTPIASGGYAWVVFTSRRLYGNVAQLPPWQSDPTQYRWHDPGNVTPKKLWVAAVDLNAAPGTDPSHPAFYLPGQELYAGNSRGYWTVPPCRPDGTSCNVGDQCCGGFCQTGADGGLVCTAQKPSCANPYEKCATNGDCCGATTGILCINNICTVPAPPK